eukprot:scaffold44799_cov25-Prasinocladus_malaysianus.AAC.1
MAPKRDKDSKPPEYMTINGQRCRRVKDPNSGKFVYRPVQVGRYPCDLPPHGKPQEPEFQS